MSTLMYTPILPQFEAQSRFDSMSAWCYSIYSGTRRSNRRRDAVLEKENIDAKSSGPTSLSIHSIDFKNYSYI